jgi:hypothetical protein
VPVSCRVPRRAVVSPFGKRVRPAKSVEPAEVTVEAGRSAATQAVRRALARALRAISRPLHHRRSRSRHPRSRPQPPPCRIPVAVTHTGSRPAPPPFCFRTYAASIGKRMASGASAPSPALPNSVRAAVAVADLLPGGPAVLAPQPPPHRLPTHRRQHRGDLVPQVLASSLVPRAREELLGNVRARRPASRPPPAGTDRTPARPAGRLPRHVLRRGAATRLPATPGPRRWAHGRTRRPSGSLRGEDDVQAGVSGVVLAGSLPPQLRRTGRLSAHRRPG